MEQGDALGVMTRAGAPRPGMLAAPVRARGGMPRRHRSGVGQTDLRTSTQQGRSVGRSGGRVRSRTLHLRPPPRWSGPKGPAMNLHLDATAARLDHAAMLQGLDTLPAMERTPVGADGSAAAHVAAPRRSLRRRLRNLFTPDRPAVTDEVWVVDTFWGRSPRAADQPAVTGSPSSASAGSSPLHRPTPPSAVGASAAAPTCGRGSARRAAAAGLRLRGRCRCRRRSPCRGCARASARRRRDRHHPGPGRRHPLTLVAAASGDAPARAELRGDALSSMCTWCPPTRSPGCSNGSPCR